MIDRNVNPIPDRTNLRVELIARPGKAAIGLATRHREVRDRELPDA